MYATHFDRLVQAMTTSGTRRGLLRLLTLLPLSGAVAAFLEKESEAATRRRRTTQPLRTADREPLQAELMRSG
jgi:hypothetical protein